jgi:hypothetical protein
LLFVIRLSACGVTVPFSSVLTENFSRTGESNYSASEIAAASHRLCSGEIAVCDFGIEQLVGELGSTSAVAGRGCRNKLVTAVTGGLAAMHDRSALRTFLVPWLCVRCDGNRLGRLRGSFNTPHAFFISLPRRTLRVNAARRVGHFATNGTKFSIRSGLQRLRLSMHDLLRESVKDSHAWGNKHGVSLRHRASHGARRRSTENVPASVHASGRSHPNARFA